MKKRKGPSHLRRLSELVAADVAAMPAALPGSEIIEVDARVCRMNPLHRRKEIDDATLDALVESMRATGQILPAKGWVDPQSPPHDPAYVLAYGARRRAAAERAGLPLRLELVEQPDPQLLIRMMYGENSGRKDYSAFERGLEMLAYLDTGAAVSMGQLADMLGEPKTTVVRYVQIARLPEAVINAYKPLTLLTARKGESLASALTKAPEARERLIEAARAWSSSGAQGDPTSHLLDAVRQPRPPRGDAVELKIGRQSVGKVTGATDPKKPLVVVLRPGAPSDIRQTLTEALKQCFPKLRL